MSSHHRPRRLASALVLPLVGLGLAASFVAPAQAAEIVDNEVCQYNYDSYWRVMPITITGRVAFATATTLPGGQNFAAGQTIPDGTNVPRGTKVQLRDATLKADQLRNGEFAPGLPDWIETFGYDSGFLQDGTVVPLNGYAAFEATNTVEGVAAPVAFDTAMTADLEVVNGQVVESSSSLMVDPAELPVVEWTAAGGPISVRQAPGTTMAPIPVGRTGGDVRVNGSVYVEANLDAASPGLRLSFDCTVGDQATTGAGGQGADHTDRLARNLAGTAGASADPADATLRSPDFAGTVSGGGTPGSLGDVDLAATSNSIGRAGSGVATQLADGRLGVRLTPAQVTAWLGNGGPATIGGTVALTGDRSTQGTQTATMAPTSVAVPAAAQPLEFSLPISATTWSPAGDLGVDVRTGDTVTLTAVVGAETRTLTLARATTHRATAYPFARVLGPDPRTPPAPGTGGGVSPGNPPVIGGGAIAPPPAVVPPAATPPMTAPKPTTKTTSVRITAATLKRAKGRLGVTLANLVKGAGTTGRFTLVTKAKYKVGKAKKAKRIALLKTTRFSLPKGKRRTYAVKLTKDGAALLKGRRSVKATLTVAPTKNVTQKTVSRTVTVRR